jgi:cytochrome bd-type quinol oxidase subunit 2
MHTIMVMASGFVLLGAFLLVARWLGGAEHAAMAAAAKNFVPVGLGAALVNMWYGVNRAGYTVSDEAPIFVVIFAVPAAVALFAWWKLA